MDLSHAPQPPLKTMVVAALAKPVAFHRWPIALQTEWHKRRRPELLYESAFVLKLGLGLALVTVITDLLIAPALAWPMFLARLALIGSITLLGLWAARCGKLEQAQLALVASVSVFGASAMWLASFGPPEDLARYSMAMVITMLVGLLILPMTLRVKFIASTVFFAFTLVGALIPPAVPPDVIVHHCAAGLVAILAAYPLAAHNWRLEARSFLLGLQQGFDRDELERSNTLLRELSESDPLTGLPNRRSLERELDAQFAGNGTGPTALMMIDIDHFKHLNDRYGHQIGDRCLVEFARELERVVSPYGGHVARWGGEEFVVLLSEGEECNSMEVAERLRHSLSQLAIATGPQDACSVTASIGVVRTKRMQSIGDLIARADEALYRAKQNGRNRVEAAYAATEDLPA